MQFYSVSQVESGYSPSQGPYGSTQQQQYRRPQIDLEVAVEGLVVSSDSALGRSAASAAPSVYGIVNAMPAPPSVVPRRVVLRTVSTDELMDTAALDQVLRSILVELGGDPRRPFERLYKDVYVVNDTLLRRIVDALTSDVGMVGAEASSSSSIPMPRPGQALQLTVRLKGSNGAVASANGNGAPAAVLSMMNSHVAPAMRAPLAPPLVPRPAVMVPPAGPSLAAVQQAQRMMLTSSGVAQTVHSSSAASTSSSSSSRSMLSGSAAPPPPMPKRTLFVPSSASSGSGSTGTTVPLVVVSSLRPTPTNVVAKPKLPPDQTCIFCGIDFTNEESVKALRTKLSTMRHHTRTGRATAPLDLEGGDLSQYFADSSGIVGHRPRLVCRRTFQGPVGDRWYVAHPRCAHITTEYQRTGSIDEVGCVGTRPRCDNCFRLDAVVCCYEPSCNKQYCIPCALFAEGLVDFGRHDPRNPVPACPRHAYTPAPGSVTEKRHRTEASDAAEEDDGRGELFDSSRSEAVARDPDGEAMR